MEKITVIVPVFNIARRGYHRLILALYSLRNQCNVIVVDGSRDSEAQYIRAICIEGNATYAPLDISEFNKPKLHNIGILLAKTEWVLCADADFVYQDGFIKSLEKYTDNSDNFIVKLIYTSSDKMPTKANIDNWKWKGKTPFPHGRQANALQLFSKSWFERCGGYDIAMAGFGAMDNDMVNRAVMAGLNVQYIECNEGPEVVHIYHQQQKNWNGPDMRKNWKIRDERKDWKV